MRPLWSIGFRPFYVGAAAFAALAVPAWYGVYRGWLPLGSPLPGMAWHAHEMIFGFGTAVIGGFLLTATRTWTGRSTPSGGALAALFALWVAGRVSMIGGPAEVAAAIDVAFPLALAAVLGVPLWQSRQRRNAFVVPLLVALAALSAAHHASYAGAIAPVWAPRAIAGALDLVALLLAVIGGRVIPAFSANAVPGLAPRRWPVVEAVAIGSLIGIAVLDVGGAALPAPLSQGLLAAAALAHAVRLIRWRPWATRHIPLLLALPLAYLWLPVHLLLRAALDTVPGSMAMPALHALAVGAMAAMMLAMMTRSALGHTDRALVAGRTEVLAFAAVHVAALTRVFGPLAWPDAHSTWLALSATAWTVAFGAFAARYWFVVTQPRLDSATPPP